MRIDLILKRIFLLMLALLLSCLTLASCEDGGSTQGGETTTGKGEEEIEPLDLSSMDLSPYISLGQYKNVPVEVKEVEYLVALREIMKEDNAYFSFVTDGGFTPSGSNDTEIVVDETRTVKEGDIINVDYKGVLDGVFENGTYIDGFAMGFVGTAVGQTSAFQVTFPENYGAPNLAGKEVTFEFTVNYIYEFDELTGEIVTDLSGGEYTSVDEYESHLRSEIVTNYLWQIVMDNATLIDYPEQQLRYCYQEHRKVYQAYANYYKIEYEELLARVGKTEEVLYAEAQALVLEDLVYYAIVDAENIIVTPQEKEDKLDTYVNFYMNKYGYTEAEIHENLLDTVYDAMLYDKMQETLVSFAVVTWQ